MDSDMLRLLNAAINIELKCRIKKFKAELERDQEYKELVQESENEKLRGTMNMDQFNNFMDKHARLWYCDRLQLIGDWDIVIWPGKGKGYNTYEQSRALQRPEWWTESDW